MKHHYDPNSDDRSTLMITSREYSMIGKPMQSHYHSQMDSEYDFEESKLKQTEKPNWTSKVKEKFGNFMYKMNHSTNYLSQYNSLDYKNSTKRPIYMIGGICFGNNRCREEVETIFKNIILFTYRKDFLEPLPSVSKKTGKPRQLKSDFGWGCMIRCGQMMLANAIMSYHRLQIFDKNLSQ